MPVAYEVATALDAPLDVFIVRKLGVPGHEEFAMGDAVIHVDETRAVEPLERMARWDEGEIPETFPSAV